MCADCAQAAEIALHQALMPEIAPSGRARAFAHGRKASGWLHCKQESIRLTAGTATRSRTGSVRSVQTAPSTRIAPAIRNATVKPKVSADASTSPPARSRRGARHRA